MRIGTCFALILFFCFKSYGLELNAIEFKKEVIHLEFANHGAVRVIEDKTGWTTLRVLSIITFQDAVEQSYLSPDQTAKILSQEVPTLKMLAPSFHKVLLYIEKQKLTDAQRELVESTLESEIFNFEKSRKRTTEEVLNNRINPLLSFEPKKQMITELKDGKRIEISRESLNPKDSIAFEITASQTTIPAKLKYRTKSRIDWNPSALKVSFLP